MRDVPRVLAYLCIVGLSAYAALAAPSARPGRQVAAGSPSATVVRSAVDIVALPRVPIVRTEAIGSCSHTICLSYGQGGVCIEAPQYFTDCIFVGGVCTTRQCQVNDPPEEECVDCCLDPPCE